jgi:GTP-binding protein
MLSLDQSIEFIAEDELVEVTPQNIRIAKRERDKQKRAILSKKLKAEAE